MPRESREPFNYRLLAGLNKEGVIPWESSFTYGLLASLNTTYLPVEGAAPLRDSRFLDLVSLFGDAYLHEDRVHQLIQSLR